MSAEFDPKPRCWWCGAVADSAEHRFKASQLRRMLDAEKSLWLDAVDRPYRVNGPGAKSMRFPRVLCKTCNNARSQAFDRAYDQFVDKVWRDPDYFRLRTKFSMLEIFPNDRRGAQHLARYYMKNIGCRIAEIGFEVPREIVKFMNGERCMPNATLVLYKDYSVFDQFNRAGTSGHYMFANRMHHPESPEDGGLVAFCAEIQDGPVGAIFWWDAQTPLGVTFSARQLIYLRERRDLPYLELHQGEWDRAVQLQRAWDARGASPAELTE